MDIPENQADAAEISIYGVIGEWDISAKLFLEWFSAIGKNQPVALKLNSPGGDVFDGVAIYSTLKQHEGGVTVVIDGLAASIASVIAMAGKEIKMGEAAMMMIHKPWTISIGNADNLRKDADTLDKIQESIRTSYKSRVKDLSDEDLDKMMSDETWMTAEEAVVFGFADGIIRGEKNEKDMSAANEIWKSFKNIPEKFFNMLPDDVKKGKEKQGEKIKNNSDSTASFPVFTMDNTASNMHIVVSDGEGNELFAVADKSTIKTEEVEMTPEEITAMKNEAAHNERVRQSNIRASGKALNIASEVIEKAIADGIMADEANALFIAKHAETLAAVPQDASVTVDEADKFRASAKASIASACGLPVKDEEKKLVSNDAPRSIHSLIRSCLRREGKLSQNRIDNLGASDIGREGIRLFKNESLGTGDLTNILADNLNKALGVGFDVSRTTYDRWTKMQPVSDFKSFKVNKLSDFSDIKTIPEGVAFERGTFSDKKESGSVSVRGRSLNISWQAIVNDDLGALTRAPMAMGGAWARHVNKMVYDELYGSGVGATLAEDSTAVFTSGHGNYVTSGSGAAISVTTLAAGRKAMRKQTAVKAQNDDGGTGTLNLMPAYLICGAYSETTAEQVTGVQYDITSAVNSITPNPFQVRGSCPLELVVEPYIDALDEKFWYLATRPTDCETIIVLALDGRVAPYIRSEESRVGEALGVNWDVYGAVGVLTADYRGLYLNEGD